MSLSTYWLMPPRWSSCPKEEISSLLDQAFGSADDAQERTADGDQHPAEGGVIALAVGPIDADYDFTPTLLVLASPIPASTTPAQALADSARSMSRSGSRLSHAGGLRVAGATRIVAAAHGDLHSGQCSHHRLPVGVDSFRRRE